MNRLLFATASFFVLAAGTAFASDPVALLTHDDQIAHIIRAAEPVPATQQLAGDPLVKVAPVIETKPLVQMQATDAKPAASPVKGPDKVELAAIYYYAQQRQDARVKAEFARLKFKYPDFEMPTDLYKPKAERIDERLLWALYNKDDIIGVDQEIARRKAADPNWTPTDDFTAKFARKKLRNTIVASHKAKNWPVVVAAGAGLNPETEKEVDLLWDMIDAYAATNNKDALGRYYRAILFRDPANAVPKSVIVATIQKATRDFAPADIRAVMAQFAADPEIMAGLANVSVDLIRREVADFNTDDSNKTPLAKSDVDALRSAAAGKDGTASDFSLLGWYYLKIKEPAEAGAWFRRALEKEQDIDHAKGLYLALVQQDRQDEAYDLALKYQGALAADPVFLMNALAERFAKPDTGKIDAEAVKAFAGTIISTKSGPHAEILAWYAYNSGQYEAARAWFTKAFAWKPEATSLKGLALAAGQLGDKPALVALYQRYSEKYPAIWADVHLNKGGRKKPRVKTDPLDAMQVGAVDRDMPAVRQQPDFLTDGDKPAKRPLRRKTSTSNDDSSSAATPGNAAGYLSSKRYGDCVATLQGRLSPDAALTKGWCLLGLKRTAEAKVAFSTALAGRGKTRSDASYGLALTLLRAKLTDDAESVIALYPLTPVRDKEIRLEIYWQKARSAFDHKQYQQTLNALNARIALTAEPTDMTQLRAWAHYNLGHLGEARAIFEQLAAYTDDPGVRRGLAAVNHSTSVTE
jgi:tetratricopeptide (TPR) repeat protein